jgi:predicted dehydrogenase
MMKSTLKTLLPESSPLVATGRTVKWGIVSTGNIARTVAKELAALEDATIHAVSSRDRQRGRAFADEVGAALSYADEGPTAGYERMANDPDVEIVYVAVPNAQHFEVALAMLEAGKHVLLEKTFTMTEAQAKELAALAEARGRFLMEAVWTRFLPLYRLVGEVVEQEMFGPVHWIQANLGFRSSFDPDSRYWSRSDGGGALLDLMVYAWTWAHGALGNPVDFDAHCAFAPNGVDETTWLTFTYAGGAQAQLTGTLVSHASREATIGCENGLIRVKGPLPNPSEVLFEGEGISETVQNEATHPYAYQLREVTRCVQNGLTESPIMPVANSVEMMHWFDRVRARVGLVF